MRSAHGPQFVMLLVLTPQWLSEDELNVYSIPDRRAVGSDAGPEFQSQQHIAQLAVVAAVRRRIEAEELRISFFVDVEVRGEMISAQRRGRRERRKEELRRRRGIILAGSTTCAGACSAARSRTGAGADSAT